MAHILAHVYGAGAGMALSLVTSFFIKPVSDPNDHYFLRNTVHELFRSSDEVQTSTIISTLLSTITIREPPVTTSITITGPTVTNPITIRRAAVASTITETATAFETQYITTQASATQVIQDYFGEVFARPSDFIPSITLPTNFYKVGFWLLLVSLLCFVACWFWRRKTFARVAPALKNTSARDAESQRLRFRESAAIISVNEEQRSIKGFPSNAPPQLNLSQVSLSDIVLAIVCGSSDLSHAKIAKATFDRLMAEWILTRDAVKLFPDHHQSRRPIYVRAIEKYVAKVEGDWNKDEETKAKALESMLHESESDGKAIINTNSLVRFASAINSARLLAVDACKEFYTAPVFTSLSRQDVPKYRVAQLAADADEGALPTLIRHFPKTTKTPKRSFRPRRSSTINSDDFEDNWDVDMSSSQPAKECKSCTAEAVAQQASTETTSPNAEVDEQPESHDDGVQDEVDEAPNPPASNYAGPLTESCSDEESEIPTLLNPGSTSIPEDVEDTPPSCEPAKESPRARSPPRDGDTDGGHQTPSAAEVNPESAAPLAPELGAKATPEDTESEKNADDSDRAPPAASKTIATKPDFSASAWYRSLFDQTFPRGWKSLFASSDGKLCGLYALIQSIEAQLPNFTPPSLDELQDIAANLNLKEQSNFFFTSLGVILHAWGQIQGLNLHVGVCDRKGNRWGIDSSGPDERSVFVQEDAIVVWICTDSGTLSPKECAAYEKDTGIAMLSHYSGVGPEDESGRDSGAKNEEGLFDQPLPEASPAQPKSEQLAPTTPGNTDNPSDVNNKSTAPASKRHKKVTFGFPVEDPHIPGDLSSASELKHSPSTVASPVSVSHDHPSTGETGQSLDTVMQDRVSVPAQGSAPDSAFSSTTVLPSQAVPQDAREAQSFPSETCSVHQDANTMPSDDRSRHFVADPDTETRNRVWAEVLRFRDDSNARLDSLSQLDERTCNQIRLELQAKLVYVSTTVFPRGVGQMWDELLPIGHQIDQLEDHVRRYVTRVESGDVSQATESTIAPPIGDDEMDFETHVADATSEPNNALSQTTKSTALPTVLLGGEVNDTRTDMEGVEHHSVLPPVGVTDEAGSPLTTAPYQTRETAVAVPPSSHEDLHYILATRRHEFAGRMSASEHLCPEQCERVRTDLQDAGEDIGDIFINQESLEAELARIENQVRSIEVTEKHASTLPHDLEDDLMADDSDDVRRQLFAGTNLASPLPLEASSQLEAMAEAEGPQDMSMPLRLDDDLYDALLREFTTDTRSEAHSPEVASPPDMVDDYHDGGLQHDEAPVATYNHNLSQYEQAAAEAHDPSLALHEQAYVDTNDRSASQQDQAYSHPYGPLMERCDTICNQLITHGAAAFEGSLGDHMQASVDGYYEIHDRHPKEPGSHPDDDEQREWQEWAEQAQGLLNQFEARNKTRNANEATNNTIMEATAPIATSPNPALAAGSAKDVADWQGREIQRHQAHRRDAIMDLTSHAGGDVTQMRLETFELKVEKVVEACQIAGAAGEPISDADFQARLDALDADFEKMRILIMKAHLKAWKQQMYKTSDRRADNTTNKMKRMNAQTEINDKYKELMDTMAKYRSMEELVAVLKKKEARLLKHYYTKP